MQTVVYADLLVIFNTVITLLIIIITADILKLDNKLIRFSAGAAAGGVFSLIIFAGQLNIFLTVFLRVVMSVIIVLLSFRVSGMKILIKCCLMLLAVSFLLAGVIYSVSYFINSNMVVHNNGIVYVDLGAGGIILIICLSMLLIRIFNRNIFSKKKSELIFNTEIEYNGATVVVRSFYDSGNSLSDAFTGRPVVIVAINEIRPFFSKPYFEQLEYITKGVISEALPEGIRLLPVQTLGHSGFLPAFTADRVRVYNKDFEHILQSPCIALSENCFDNKNYSALINEAVTGQVM